MSESCGFPRLKKSIWLWSLPLVEYMMCGGMLPASTFQSVPSLKHVSLQYIFGEYHKCNAEKLDKTLLVFPQGKQGKTFLVFSNVVLGDH
jgi:hypothetical protein